MPNYEDRWEALTEWVEDKNRWDEQIDNQNLYQKMCDLNEEFE